MTKSHYLSVPWLLLLDHQPHLYSPREAAAAQGKISSEQRTCYVQIVISEGSATQPGEKRKAAAVRNANGFKSST